MNTIGRIQTLSEDVEDIVEIDGILADDINTRQIALSVATKVTQHGRQIAQKNDSFITCDSTRFVIESPLNEHDTDDRQIPVGYCGLRKGFEKSATSAEIQAFVKRSGRSVSPDSISDMEFCLNALSVANKMRKQRLIIISLLGFSILVLLSILMVRR